MELGRTAGVTITRVGWDGSITLPYWMFKRGGLLHGRRQVSWSVRDGSVALEPVDVVWLKAPRKPYKVVIHTEAADGALWAEVPCLPGLRVTAASMREIRARVRIAIQMNEAQDYSKTGWKPSVTVTQSRL